MARERTYGCVETGGTKWVIALVTGDRRIVARHRLPTTTPDATIGAAVDWLGDAARDEDRIRAIGIASFGPVELDRASPRWGRITETPKPGWRGVDVAGPFVSRFGVPVGFDTDVDGAAIAEARWGAAQGTRVAAYLTVGTGIGGGLVVDGKAVHGLGHPEMGHIAVRRHPLDAYPGTCPYHGDCLEGLTAGPAILARWGASLSDLPTDHEAHDIIAFYLAQLCLALRGIAAPERIVIGGGVGGTYGLVHRVASECDRLAARYYRGSAADIVRAPALGGDSGLLGALALALDAETMR